jgi:DNA helicase-2/ATP-dependent DNA helicase PcrA
VKAPDFSKILNPAQLEAATYDGGPLLVIAGAGSGKTRTLVHRVAWLVSRGEDPRRILLLTFTRKAAGEMLGRCAELVGPEAGRVSGGTFHSIANLLLRAEHSLVGYPAAFGILAQDDAEIIIGRIRENMADAKNENRFPKKGAILQVISRSVNKELSVIETIRRFFPHLGRYERHIEKIAELYAEAKRRQAVMDFDDLLVKFSQLMEREPEARERIAGRYSHVLVDEYQDTNPVQARIAWQLGRDHRNVTAVGDDAQSIYGFRGADFNNIMNFPELFAPARVLKLEDNYRSYANILRVANCIFKGAERKYDKTLKAARGEGPQPLLVVTGNLKSEARWAGLRIDELIRTGTDPGEIAVLFRAGYHSFELELELVRLNIPFTKYGGRRLLEGAHVKDFLSFFRVAANPADETSLTRVLMMLPGVGPKGAADAAGWVGGDRARLRDFKKAPLRGRGAAAGAERLAKLFSAVCGDEDEMGSRPGAVLAYYAPLMKGLYPDDYPDRAEEVLEIRGMAEESGSLSSFLADLTLDPPNTVSKGGAGDGGRRDLTLSTVHSAKGLEWGSVFVLSAVDGRIPSSYSLQKKDELDEERRLFYVAVTRAKDELYVMCPLEIAAGWSGPTAANPTRFLSGLDEGEVDAIQDGRKVNLRSLYPSGLADGDGGFSGDSDGWGPAFGGVESDFSEQSGSPVPGLAPGRGSGAPAPAAKRPQWKPAPPEDLISEPREGERVGHLTFGAGTVLSFKDGKAVIDFDCCGRKIITCRHARLYRQKGA